jgi:hypothetical protein
MIDKLVERKEAEAKAYRGVSTERNKVSDEEMFSLLGNKIRRTSHGN